MVKGMMKMSNSPLVSYTQISPNKNSPRKYPISKITLHHMAGNLSLEAFGNLVAKPSRQMSANYAVDINGNIGLYCDEGDRSWCSSSPSNDHRAITVEIANDKFAPSWTISDASLAAVIDLCVDICKRNNMPGLTWTGDYSGTLTCHYMFANTACCGPYLETKMPWIAEEVTRRVKGETYRTFIKLDRTPLYISSTAVNPYSVRSGNYFIWSDEVVNGRIRITNDPDRIGVSGQVTGWIDYPTIANYTLLKAIYIPNVFNLSAFYFQDLANKLSLNYNSAYADSEQLTQNVLIAPVSSGDLEAIKNLANSMKAIYEIFNYSEGEKQ